MLGLPARIHLRIRFLRSEITETGLTDIRLNRISLMEQPIDCISLKNSLMEQPISLEQPIDCISLDRISLMEQPIDCIRLNGISLME
jgi:hypothetical protein